MKALFFISISVLLLLASCSSSENDAFKEFIPGTYIRFSQHEFGKEYDTLVISLQNESASHYQILRKWRYERVLDGKSIEPEYKQENSSAIYNPETKVLQETKTLELSTFDPEKKLLFNGTNEFTKIK